MRQKQKYDGNALRLLNMLILRKSTFDVEMSNYTMKITYQNGKSISFISAFKSNNFFAMGKKIEKQVLESDDYLHISTHDLVNRQPKYFFPKFPFL